MKKLITILLCITLMLGAFPFAAFAEGDPNIDGGGGSMGTGTLTDRWSGGNDGVRITVVDAGTGAAVATPMDFSNKAQSSSLIHFGNHNKLQYLGGAALFPATGMAYQCYKPAYDMPMIISGGGRNNIDAIKRYFCSEYAAMMVADAAGVDYGRMVGGDYKLLLEPIAYFLHNSQHYCMTATEAALYDQLAGGGLRSKLPSLSHQNLPLAMFLETPDLGLPAYNGSVSSRQSNDVIISSLGAGIVSYNDDPFEPPEPSESDVEYRVNTEVVTAVTLNAVGEINPDNPASVTFFINGTAYTVNSIVIPEGGSQLVWLKWTTPATEQMMTITVRSSMGYLSANIITAKIVDLSRNPPPDPRATDRNDAFITPALPNNAQQPSASWSVWWAQWHPFWVWIENWVTYDDSWEYTDADGNTSSGGGSYSVDEGWWEDQGWYDFYTNNYTASITATSTISSDEKVPTAAGKQMKSGYGINNKVTANFSTNAPAAHVAAAQTAVSYFPEFRYNTYWRLLEKTSGSYMAQLEFRRNPFSTYDQRAHFTPVWFPNGTYTVYTWLLDAWTPAGMLSTNLSDYVTIQQSVFDDWYTNRE